MPKTFSEAERKRIVDAACDMIVDEKMSLVKALKAIPGACSYTQFSAWQRTYEDVAEQVARAREAALEALIEEMVEIADNDKLDHNSRRVRLLAREKAATMLAPRRFGIQRMDVTTDGKPLPTGAQSATPMDRIASILEMALMRRAQGSPMIDVTPQPQLIDVLS